MILSYFQNKSRKREVNWRMQISILPHMHEFWTSKGVGAPFFAFIKEFFGAGLPSARKCVVFCKMLPCFFFMTEHKQKQGIELANVNPVFNHNT